MASSEKNETLEDFVKTYVQNKAKSSSKESYEDWLRTNGVNSKEIYSDSIKDITADYERAKSGYGRKAETLSGLGLTTSGYSDYLASSAYSLMQKRKAGAQNKYSENEIANRKAYSDYIKEISDADSKAYKNVVNTISNEGIVDYEKAYTYAVNAGLSEENAKLAAETASEIARRNLKQSAMKTIISRYFNTNQAREYALALGLSSEDAKELAEYASTINKYSHYDSDYLEYLKHKAESQSTVK